MLRTIEASCGCEVRAAVANNKQENGYCRSPSNRHHRSTYSRAPMMRLIYGPAGHRALMEAVSQHIHRPPATQTPSTAGRSRP